MDKKVKNLVVGCGLSGTVIANKIATELKEPVLIIDSKEHIAGTCYDYKDSSGITVHKYGPHIFRTNSKEAFILLNYFFQYD